MEFCVLDVAGIFYTSLSVDFTIEFRAIKNLQQALHDHAARNLQC